MITLLAVLAQTDAPDPDGGSGFVGMLMVLLSMAFALSIFFVLPVWGIVDAIRRPPEQWDAAGQSKSLWIVIQFIAWIIGSLIYVFAVRPRLRSAEGISG